MVKGAAKKVTWVGRATTFMVGLAVILALTGLAPKSGFEPKS